MSLHPILITVDVPGNERWTALVAHGTDLRLEPASLNRAIRDALAVAADANASLEEST